MNQVAFMLLVQPSYETEVGVCFQAIRPGALFGNLKTPVVECDCGGLVTMYITHVNVDRIEFDWCTEIMELGDEVQVNPLIAENCKRE